MRRPAGLSGSEQELVAEIIDDESLKNSPAMELGKVVDRDEKGARAADEIHAPCVEIGHDDVDELTATVMKDLVDGDESGLWHGVWGKSGRG